MQDRVEQLTERLETGSNVGDQEKSSREKSVEDSTDFGAKAKRGRGN